MKEKNITAEQQALASEITKKNAEWQTITEDDLLDFSLADEPYPLPEEAKKALAEKKFVFRWIEDKMSRLREVMRMTVPERWWPCNAVNTPFLEKYVDSCTGGVHCKDQILVFKPYWMHMVRQEAILKSAELGLKSADLKAKHGERDEHGSEWITGKRSEVRGNDIVVETEKEE